MAISNEWRTLNRGKALQHAVELENTRIAQGLVARDAKHVTNDAEEFRKFLDGVSTD